MVRLSLLAAAVALSIAAAAAATVAPDLPPAPSTWTAYPAFSHRSCWARPAPGGGGPLRDAPSYVSAPTHRTPAAIAKALLGRLGDRRYVGSIVFGSPPPVTRQHTGWFTHGRPPPGSLWAYVGERKPKANVARAVADWETGLVTGALRDELCAAGGRSLVGWTVGGTIGGVSDAGQAFGQRFPNESPSAFRRRLAAVGAQFGFRVVHARLLRPLQLAPLVLVRTDRPRKAFVHDMSKIMGLLDPRNGQAVTFEGFFLVTEDAHGPFVFEDDAYRGQVMGGGWSWNPCVMPFVTSGPPPGRRC